MTNEEAIEDIRDNIKPVVGGISLDMAIKALEQQPCEDCVSREAVLDIVNNPLNIRLDEIIKKLPSVQPKGWSGEWEYVQYDTPNIGNWHCSRCRELYYSTDKPRWKYCPNCGARMEAEA